MIQSRPLAIAVAFGAIGMAACSSDVAPTHEPTATHQLALGAASEIAEQVGDPDGRGARQLAPAAIRRALLGEAERAEMASFKARLPRLPASPPTPGPTPRALERAKASPAGTRIELTVELEDDSVALDAIRGAAAGERANAIAARVAALAPAQATVEAAIKKLGGAVSHRFWLSNQIEAVIPAESAPALAVTSGVRAIHWTSHEAPAPQGAYTGFEIRAGALTSAFVASGKVASRGNRASGGPVRIAFFESMGSESFPNALDPSHVGLLPWASGPSRVVDRFKCTDYASGCALDETLPNVTSHGMAVVTAAAGSIENGQDWVFSSDPIQSVAHSGQASGSKLWYFRIDSAGGMKRALEYAASAGIDIVNVSFGWTGSLPCNINGDHDWDNEGLNGFLRSSYDLGITLVGSAGDAGGLNGSNCNMVYPMWRPEVLAINGLDTSDSTQGYSTTVLSSAASARGGAYMCLYGGGWCVSRAGIALSAPGVFTNAYRSDLIRYDSSHWTGSSFASPVVAGAAALLRGALHDIGWNTDGRFLFVEMLAQSDSWDHGTGLTRTSGSSNTSGAGRVRMHYPAPGGISGNWAWGQRAFWLYPGQTVSFSVGSGTSLPSSIRQWKWAVYWNETNLNAVSDIDIEVWDTCTNTRVAYQWDYDLRNRIQLRDAEIWGRCLEMRVKAYYVDSPRLVWSADFYHGSVD